MPSKPPYVDKGSFHYLPEEWERAKSEARDAMIDAARRRSTIAYGELARSIRAIRFDPRAQPFFALLGQIAENEHRAGRPLLSVVVVHKDGDQMPGPGFFELAAALGRASKDRLALWMNELNAVYEFWGKTT
jgi:hypothetical protein